MIGASEKLASNKLAFRTDINSIMYAKSGGNKPDAKSGEVSEKYILNKHRC